MKQLTIFCHIFVIVSTCSASSPSKQVETEIVAAVISFLETPDPYMEMFRRLSVRKVERKDFIGPYFLVAQDEEGHCDPALLKKFESSRVPVRALADRDSLVGILACYGTTVKLTSIEMFGDDVASVQVLLRIFNSLAPHRYSRVNRTEESTPVSTVSNYTFVVEKNWNLWRVSQASEYGRVFYPDGVSKVGLYAFEEEGAAYERLLSYCFLRYNGWKLGWGWKNKYRR